MLQRKIEQTLLDWKKATTSNTNGSPKKSGELGNGAQRDVMLTAQ